MLSRLDRIQCVVGDRAAAAETYRRYFGAEILRQGGSRLQNAHITVIQVGDSEVELLEPAGDGPVADFAAKWGEGLYGVGFATADLAGIEAKFQAFRVPYEEERGRLVIHGHEGHGMPTIISADVAREPVGWMRHIYEVTNPVPDAAATTKLYSTIFGLDDSRFCPIRSERYGYEGSLTLFNPPERLDRVEVVTTFGGGAMDRFFQKRGAGLYMCYAETDDVPTLASRLKASGARFAQGGDRPEETGLFIHPSALHGMLMGVSRTNYAWVWSGRPELAGEGAEAYSAH